MKKKANGTTSSITSPLQQQSGIANPSTKTVASPKALFTTSYDAWISM